MHINWKFAIYFKWRETVNQKLQWFTITNWVNTSWISLQVYYSCPDGLQSCAKRPRTHTQSNFPIFVVKDTGLKGRKVLTWRGTNVPRLTLGTVLEHKLSSSNKEANTVASTRQKVPTLSYNSSGGKWSRVHRSLYSTRSYGNPRSFCLGVLPFPSMVS